MTPEALRKYVGVLFLSGYHTLPRQRLYWEGQRDTLVGVLSNSISRNNFEKLKRYTHLADNENLEAGVKFAKVMPLYHLANKSLKQFGCFHNSYSIDEQIIPYNGRHSAKQTNREKVVRFGYKNFVITGADGYCYHIIPYEGAKTGSAGPGTSQGQCLSAVKNAK